MNQIPADVQTNTISLELNSISQIELELNKDLYGWWLENKGLRPAPLWRDFDILDFLHCSKHITLTERIESEKFQFKIQGESTLDLLGRDRLFNAVLSEDHVEEYERYLFRHYSEICKQDQPYIYKGTIPVLGRGHVYFESIDLPFQNDQGVTDKVLSMLVEFTNK